MSASENKKTGVYSYILEIEIIKKLQNLFSKE